jgi:glycine/D-amino acid oxidase-like deaminating enzyme
MLSQSRRSKVEAMRNIQPLNNVVITDDINPAFEVLEASGNGLTVKTNGQKVEATRAVLAGGEEVKVTIKVRARPSDVLPVTISNQATLLYTGLPLNVFSNIVDITVAAKNAPTATAAPTRVPTNTPLAGPGSAGGTPPDVPQPAKPEDLGKNLPQTSGGVPLFGFVLLGLTLLLHSIRVHRSRVRI